MLPEVRSVIPVKFI